MSACACQTHAHASVRFHLLPEGVVLLQGATVEIAHEQSVGYLRSERGKHRVVDLAARSLARRELTQACTLTCTLTLTQGALTFTHTYVYTYVCENLKRKGRSSIVVSCLGFLVLLCAPGTVVAP